MKILIAGLGFVGTAMLEMFPQADAYDPFRKNIPNHIRIFSSPPREQYDYCFVCTPTPMADDGSCDISAVEDVIHKIDARVFIIRSTISIGSSDYLQAKYNKRIVFQPEYVASSSPYPAPLANEHTRTFIILGGEKDSVKMVRRLYQSCYPPTVRFIECTAIEAEIIKYMENSFIATYVTFCNEYYDICKQFNADYDVVREGFLADPRMTPWWTYVYENKRGWGGHCLGKDLSAVHHTTKSSFLKNIIKQNDRHRNKGVL